MVHVPRIFMALSGVVVLTAVASGDTWTNGAGNNDWYNGLNWSDGSAPTSTDSAVVELTGANRAVIGPGTADAQDVLAGDHGSGEIDILAGSLLLARKIISGTNNGSSGIVNMSGGSVDLLEDLLIGLEPGSTGSFTQSGGDVLARKVIVGVNRNAANGAGVGSYSLSGDSTLDLVEDLLVGLKGHGSFTQSGGDIIAGKLILGVDKPDTGVALGGTGTYDMQGGTLDLLGHVGVAFGAGTTATWTQSGGDVLATQMLLGDQGPDVGAGLPASHGTANISGGTIDLIETFRVGNGNDSKGTLNMSGGTILSNNFLLGDGNKGSGAVTLSGTAKLDLLGVLFMTGNGTSTFSMTGGEVVSGNIVVGGNGKVVADISGGVINTGSFLLSDSPTGIAEVEMTGGTMNLTGNVRLGWGSSVAVDGGISGKFTMNGADAVINAANIIIRDEVHMGMPAFEFELFNGTINLTGNLADQTVNGSPQFGLFDMHGGKLTLDGDKVTQIESRITAGDLTASGAASSMLSDFSIIFDGTETVVMLSGGAVAGDYNGNGIVDAADYTVWRDTLGSTTNPAADGDGNGTVQTADYNFWRARFGNTSGSGSSAGSAVPEPSSLLLVCCALVGCFAAHRRCK